LFRIATKTVRVFVVGGLIASVGLPAAALVSSSSASAAPKATPDQLNGVGSDTIFCVDNRYAPKYSANTPHGVNPNGNQIVNTPPALGLAIGCETTPATFTVPADSVHGTITYNGANPPPFGSSAGITAFVADNGSGNIAYTRSSRGRKSTDPANLEFYAFALDAVTWNHFSGHAPTKLTQAQLIGIYKCDAITNQPQFTNWSQLPGGRAGKIVRYTAQSGSGTRSFFESIVLGGNSSNDANCTVKSIEVPENDATQIKPADRPNAIFPYSLAVYTAQKNPATGETNLGKGTLLGGLNGVKATLATVDENSAKTNASGGDACSAPTTGFCASRYVYHTTWQMLPATYYADTISFMGVNRTTGVPGALCNNKYVNDVKLFGFKNLALDFTQQGSLSVPGKSFCRLF
jgi:ABC-type phosphate transport system substrate-binding protein